MGLGESDTRAKLIDPALYRRLTALKALGKPADVLRETKERMFAA